MYICVIGTGYVGLVSAACFAEMGNNVYCVDINAAIIDALSHGEIHIFEPGLSELVKRNTSEGRLHFTTDLNKGLEQAKVAFITVGTPATVDGRCDTSYIEHAALELGRCMLSPLIIVNKSTVPVGTADKIRFLVKKSLMDRSMELSFDVVSNPEFLKEGDAIADFMKPDRIIVGTDSKKSAHLLYELYAPFARNREKLIIMSVRSAELTKYAANCMLATKISFINEIALLCEKLGADVQEVRKGIGADHRIGYHFIYPGVGYGGSCFPKDVKALIHTASEIGIESKLLEAVDFVNERQKCLMAVKIQEYFSSQGGVEGKTLALWGLAFKANTDDVREAPAMAIINTLTAHGMYIRAFDPIAHNTAKAVLHDNMFVSIETDPYAICTHADALLVVTEWNQFRNPDFEKIKTLLNEPVIFDGRNLYSPSVMKKYGFIYYCIGYGK